MTDTPIGDEAKAAAAAQPTEVPAPDTTPADSKLEYLTSADEADLTHFDEDDDPLQFSGDPVEEN